MRVNNNYDYYANGKYFKRCAFEPCGNIFPGPLNKLYCSDTCRERQKAVNRKKVSLAADGDDLRIKKATRIIQKLYKPNFHGWFKVHEIKLIGEGFPFDLPTKKVKIDIYDGELECFGMFAFCKKGEFFYFYKYI